MRFETLIQFSKDMRISTRTSVRSLIFFSVLLPVLPLCAFYSIHYGVLDRTYLSIRRSLLMVLCRFLGLGILVGIQSRIGQCFDSRRIGEFGKNWTLRLSSESCTCRLCFCSCSLRSRKRNLSLSQNLLQRNHKNRRKSSEIENGT